MALFLTAALAMTGASVAEAKTFKNCVELRKIYKYGVSASIRSVNKGRGPIFTPKVMSSVYRANARMDLDKDRIICEVVKPASDLPSGSDLPKLDLCRIAQGSNPNGAIRTGFPRNADLSLKNKKAVVQLIYVDFPDLSDESSPSSDVSFWKDGVNGFFEAMSDGNVEFDWRFENQYFRMPRSISSYALTREGRGDFNQFIQDAITTADPFVDFTSVDFVVAVLPPNVTREQADVSPALITIHKPYISKEGKIFRATLAAADTRFSEGYLLIAHEFGHLLGLEDYYNYGWRNGMPYHEQFAYMGQFDNMNFATGKSKEWVAWNRWALGFLDDSKVKCLAKVNSSTSNTVLVPASARVPGMQMIVIPTSSTSAIAVESRRNLRYDQAASAISNGLLVYRIDTLRTSGFGPIQVIRKTTTTDQFLADAPIRQGESITVDGITITNLSSQKTSDLVSITISG